MSASFWQKFELGALAFLVLGTASITPQSCPISLIHIPFAWCKSKIWQKDKVHIMGL